MTTQHKRTEATQCSYSAWKSDQPIGLPSRKRVTVGPAGAFAFVFSFKGGKN